MKRARSVSSHRARWLPAPKAGDLPGAESFLSLLSSDATARRHADRLRKARRKDYRAKDVLRASGLPVLGAADPDVARNRSMIRRGLALSPLLLVRDSKSGRVVIADGYHRLCAAYSFDRDALVSCRIV
jgi:hypothetical protein